jgi:hypothetical protein
MKFDVLPKPELVIFDNDQDPEACFNINDMPVPDATGSVRPV